MRPIGLVPELYCSDIGKTREFYVGVLGFEILYQREEDKFIYFQKRNARMMFEQIGVSRNWISGELEYPFGRGINFQIETDNVDELYATITSSQIKPFLPIEEKWYRKDNIYAGNRQFIVQDPDGYLLRFFQDLGTKA